MTKFIERQLLSKNSSINTNEKEKPENLAVETNKRKTFPFHRDPFSFPLFFRKSNWGKKETCNKILIKK